MPRFSFFFSSSVLPFALSNRILWLQKLHCDTDAGAKLCPPGFEQERCLTSCLIEIHHGQGREGVKRPILKILWRAFV